MATKREREREKTKRTFDPGPDAFIILLFNTSAGEHTVVATVPAAKLAVKWHKMLSSNIWVLMSSALKKSYLMNKGRQRSQSRIGLAEKRSQLGEGSRKKEALTKPAD